jgi:hypothetical protein
MFGPTTYSEAKLFALSIFSNGNRHFDFHWIHNIKLDKQNKQLASLIT